MTINSETTVPKRDKNSVLMIWALGFRNPRMIKQAKSLVAHGYDVEMAYWHRSLGDEEAFEAKYDLSAFSIHRLRTSKASMGRGTANLFRRLHFVLRTAILTLRSRAGIVHAIDFDAALGSLIGQTLSRRDRFLVYDIADFLEDYQSNYPSAIKWVIKKVSSVVCRKADFVIIPDETRRRHLPSDVQERAVIVNNAPDLRDLGLLSAGNGQHRPKDGKVIVYYYGTMTEDRGVNELMSAVIELGDEYELWIAGWGPLEARVKEVEANIGRIKFMGSLDQKSALEKLTSVDAVYAVYDPSVKINQMASPTKFFEAMAFDRPVIVCRGTTIDKLVEDAGVGLVVDYHANSVKSALAKLKSDDTREFLLRNIRSIKNGYLWETSERNLLDVYNGIQSHMVMSSRAVMQ